MKGTKQKTKEPVMSKYDNEFTEKNIILAEIVNEVDDIWEKHFDLEDAFRAKEHLNKNNILTEIKNESQKTRKKIQEALKKHVNDGLDLKKNSEIPLFLKRIENILEPYDTSADFDLKEILKIQEELNKFKKPLDEWVMSNPKQ